jgi:hypothetical protein
MSQMPPAPRLDGRDLAAFLRAAAELRPFYTPEWRPQSGDPGAALLEIAARMLEATVQRLDEAPGKHFLAFLDMIGVKLLPAQPARVPLTFVLSSGAREPVTVPARSRAAAKPPAGGDPIPFETEAAFVATPARPAAFLAAVPARDLVFDHGPDLALGGGATLLAGDDRQEHALYLGHATLFNVEGPARIDLAVSPFDSRLVPATSPFGIFRMAPGALWEYAAGERDWRPLGAALAGNRIVLTKRNADPIAELKIAGVKSRWLRCRVEPGGIAALSPVRIDSIRASVQPLGTDITTTSLVPGLLFANDVELAPDQPFLPFGSRPRLADVLSVGSREAFSKPGSRITLHLTLQAAGVPSADLKLAWEYWDGRGWRALPGLADGTERLARTGDVSFDGPADLQPVKVLGQESLWIRVRIVSGDYGRETFAVVNGTVTPGTSGIHPPVVGSLRIAYEARLTAPEALLTGNNLDLRPWSGSGRLQPFVPLEAGSQALYLGFDRALERGPLSLFFALEEQEVAETDRPRIEWEALTFPPGETAGRWVRLETLDGTRGLIESGTLQLFPPPGLAPGRLFGREAWWLRAVDADDRFLASPRTAGTGFDLPIFPTLPFPGPSEPGFDPLEAGLEASVARAVPAAEAAEVASGVTAGTAPRAVLACAQRDPRVEALRNLPHPSLAASQSTGRPPLPRLRGLFPNTAWATQGETIDGEILGSGTGLARQRFATVKTPVQDEEVWIDELGSLSEGERAALARPDVEHREVTDDTGAVLAFLVRWLPVEDLAEAGPEDRVYAIDRTFGQIEFGDSLHGRVPPPGRDNVRATYRAGGGTRGNLAAGTITSLRTTVPLVDSTFNPEPATGGADTEPLERAVERGPQRIRHGGRAVTRADYEALAREASPAVARARCLPRFDDRGREQSGWVTVVVVPESGEARPFPSIGLRRTVARFLGERAANVAAFPGRVRVIGPAYVEVSVAADLFPSSADLAPAAEAAAFRRLGEFLHPLTGGYAGRGWELGRLPCLSDFFALLEAVPGLDHVESLAMTLTSVKPDGKPAGQPIEFTPDRPVEAALPDYALVFGGEHRLRSRLRR